VRAKSFEYIEITIRLTRIQRPGKIKQRYSFKQRIKLKA